MLKNLTIVCVCMLLAGMCAAAQADEGGTLTGRFVYDGTAAVPAPVEIKADVAYCGKKEHKEKLVDESLVVGEGGGLANVFVYMNPAAGAKVKIHPAYEAQRAVPVRLDNLGCRFTPHVAGMWTEQKLILGNKDAIGHNTKIDGIEGKSVNPLLPPNSELEETFKISERLPLNVGCNIHPWMRARLLIQDHPYFATSDVDGTFEIKNIPPGEYTFRAYHERPGYVRTVKLDGKPTEWKAGRFTVKLEEGKTADLGDVLVPADLLKAQ